MSIQDKYLSVRIIGPGKEFFQEAIQAHKAEFSENKLFIGIPEGFSAPEITNAIIEIGVSVIAALSTHYLIKTIDSIFTAKKKASESGINITINVVINNGDKCINLGSSQEEIKQEIIKAKSNSE